MEQPYSHLHGDDAGREDEPRSAFLRTSTLFARIRKLNAVGHLSLSETWRIYRRAIISSRRYVSPRIHFRENPKMPILSDSIIANRRREIVTQFLLIAVREVEELGYLATYSKHHSWYFLLELFDHSIPLYTSSFIFNYHEYLYFEYQDSNRQ